MSVQRSGGVRALDGARMGAELHVAEDAPVGGDMRTFLG